MKRLFNIVLWPFLWIAIPNLLAQEANVAMDSVLTFQEYLGYVKAYHPLVKQANLKLTEGEATLLRARGGFDPKIEVDFNRKKFKGTEYYDELNAAFKIPTWYGVEFKADFEENSGEFLDPSLTVPTQGLYSAGVSFSLAQGLLINDRMATLKQAKYFVEQTKAERDLLVNQVVFEASLAYFEWIQAHNEQRIYKNFLDNALMRFKGVKRSVEEGDKAAIDSTEAHITFQTRQLNLEVANLKRRKAALKVSNYLWLEDVPLVLEENTIPQLPSEAVLETSLFLDGITISPLTITSHPKLRSLNAKIDGLEVERFLKRNKLLPKIDLQYNFLTTENDQLSSFNTANYKAALNLSFPVFLRKERGALKLANLKLQDATFDLSATSLSLQNKILAVQAEIFSLEKQNSLVSQIVTDYERLVAAEERKFQLGESSLFLVNSREQKLIEASLREIELQVKFLDANAKLYNTLGVGIGEVE
ncbi:TolC family protein [Marinirhabdus gelatinilytica]|uniref:Outer membrane protein TolC n=1 Tax=Marinirhabdus gelatinilytica TaxID=1703343 RepID=A0A370Q4P7_9FLAO|nr:TolC family protein [Marinirhabdus gelatinilytica]RDK83259.1 outer membrane protein TolC [Marinirhabdus gelatinilytica]